MINTTIFLTLSLSVYSKIFKKNSPYWLLLLPIVSLNALWGSLFYSTFLVHTRVRQGCILAPSLFNTCKNWVLGKFVDQSHCGASVSNTKITDLVFAEDTVIFAESPEILVMAPEALREEVKPLGLQISWPKTKVQVFGGCAVYSCVWRRH